MDLFKFLVQLLTKLTLWFPIAFVYLVCLQFVFNSQLFLFIFSLPEKKNLTLYDAASKTLLQIFLWLCSPNRISLTFASLAPGID